MEPKWILNIEYPQLYKFVAMNKENQMLVANELVEFEK